MYFVYTKIVIYIIIQYNKSNFYNNEQIWNRYKLTKTFKNYCDRIDGLEKEERKPMALVKTELLWPLLVVYIYIYRSRFRAVEWRQWSVGHGIWWWWLRTARATRAWLYSCTVGSVADDDGNSGECNRSPLNWRSFALRRALRKTDSNRLLFCRGRSKY